MAFRTKSQRRQFKKSIDPTESRRRREEMTVELRKSKRETQLMKRRLTTASSSQFEGDEKGMSERLKQRLAELPALVEGVKCSDPAKQLQCARRFRQLLSIERDPPIQAVVEAGVVPRLVEFLKIENNPPLQFEAAWALTNVASGESVHTRHVIEHGAVPIFVALLRSTNEKVQEQATWALGNIAGDSTDCRNLVLQTGALGPLLQLCTPRAKPSLLKNATWTLSNLCRGKPPPPFEHVSAALPTLAFLLQYKDDEVLTDACWALSYLSDDTGPENRKIQAVIQSGVSRRLVELLMWRNVNVQTPALRTVGNIVTGDDQQTQVIIHSGALPLLLALLINSKKAIRKEACWTISNITAGNSEQIQAVIDANIVPAIVSILRDAEFDIQKEAAWAISNATSGGTDEQIRTLVNVGCIPPLCELLKCADSKIVLVALEALDNILRVGKADAEKSTSGTNIFADLVEDCEGIDTIEALQRHDNEDIYRKSVQLVQTYFDSEEEEDATLAPQVAANAQQFAFGGAPAGPAPSAGGFHFQ